jgi:PAS domain S-box-containing protein
VKPLRPLVLVIDDQPANLLALEATLKDCDYDVVTASSGKEGIALLCEKDFAAILLDVQMPEMDGYETALWVRARGIRTPIIFLTAIHASETHAMRGYEAGAVDFLFKPINTEILRAKLAVLVDLFRKQREIEIKSALMEEHANRRYRDLVEGIPNGIVWTAVLGSGKFSYVSASAENISGYPREDWMANKHFLMMHSHPDDVETLGSAIGTLSARGGDVELEHRFVRADGSVMWLHTTIRVADMDSYRELRGLSVDITSLKETEQSLRQTISIRDEFLSIASHELKTPLTPLQLQIEGFQRLSKRGELARLPDETLVRMLDVSASQVGTLSRLVDQLLDVSRIKAGRISMERAEMDLAALVRKVVALFHTNLTLGKIETTLDLPERLSGQWDAARLQQVVMNLIDNAIKYGRGRPIRIALKETGGAAELTIEDQGIGISADNQKRIFRRFERAVSTGNYSGMGLGLYITRQIVDLHGGEISVRSSPGKGSTFTLRLPSYS